MGRVRSGWVNTVLTKDAPDTNLIRVWPGFLTVLGESTGLTQVRHDQTVSGTCPTRARHRYGAHLSISVLHRWQLQIMAQNFIRGACMKIQFTLKSSSAVFSTTKPSYYHYPWSFIAATFRFFSGEQVFSLEIFIYSTKSIPSLVLLLPITLQAFNPLLDCCCCLFSQLSNSFWNLTISVGGKTQCFIQIGTTDCCNNSCLWVDDLPFHNDLCSFGISDCFWLLPQIFMWQSIWVN